MFIHALITWSFQDIEFFNVIKYPLPVFPKPLVFFATTKCEKVSSECLLISSSTSLSVPTHIYFGNNLRAYVSIKLLSSEQTWVARIPDCAAEVINISWIGF